MTPHGSVRSRLCSMHRTAATGTTDCCQRSELLVSLSTTTDVELSTVLRSESTVQKRVEPPPSPGASDPPGAIAPGHRRTPQALRALRNGVDPAEPRKPLVGRLLSNIARQLSATPERVVPPRPARLSGAGHRATERLTAAEEARGLMQRALNGTARCDGFCSGPAPGRGAVRVRTPTTDATAAVRADSLRQHRRRTKIAAAERSQTANKPISKVETVAAETALAQ